MLPKNVLQYGKDEPLPKRYKLNAGPINMIYENGDLRYIKYGDQEVIRRIYVAIRDRNWGTVPPKLSNVQKDLKSGAFRIAYEVENQQNEIDFSWHGEITGDSNGIICFRMEGIARSTFWRNRIGFCILHPANLAGKRCIIEHIDGTKEEAFLPTIISADQPVQPFAEMRAMTYDVVPGVCVETRYEGEIFEIEDQRNWTDASFKTYCTPLNLHRPIIVQKGTKITQKVTLKLLGQAEAITLRGKRKTNTISPLSFSVKLDHTLGVLPDLGLSVASHNQKFSVRQINLLRDLHLNHLRVDLNLEDKKLSEKMERAVNEGKELGLPLEIGLTLSRLNENEKELSKFKRLLEQIKPDICGWILICPKTSTPGELIFRDSVLLARKYLSGCCPLAQFGSGTNFDLIFLLRNPPPKDVIDFVTFAINPQVHAFDNLSIVETLEIQAVAVESARNLVDGLPVVVGPVTLKQQFNPNIEAIDSSDEINSLPPQVDVRQMSLLAAGWTIGSLKYLAQSRAKSITYYETTGWLGIMEHETGSPLPEIFKSIPGSVYPIYHVLADLSDFKNGQVIYSHSSDPLKIEGLAVKNDRHVLILITNLTAERQFVVIDGISGRILIDQLDDENVLNAMQSPAEFRRCQGNTLEVSGSLNLYLSPYSYARIISYVSC